MNIDNHMQCCDSEHHMCINQHDCAECRDNGMDCKQCQQTMFTIEFNGEVVRTCHEEIENDISCEHGYHLTYENGLYSCVYSYSSFFKSTVFSFLHYFAFLKSDVCDAKCADQASCNTGTGMVRNV